MMINISHVSASCVLVFASTSLIAQDCVVSINENDPGRDVTRILKCFDERIKFLESQISAGNASSATGAPLTSSEFDAGSFAVSVRSAARDNTSINVLLTVRNKTTNDVYIAIPNQDWGGATLFDEANGTSDRTFQAAGLSMVSSWSAIGAYSVIPAASQISAAFKFDGSKIRGNITRLTLTLSQFVAGKEKKRVTVSLGVRIRN